MPTKTANIEAVGAGQTSATFTTTKEGADPVSLDINIVVKGETKIFHYIKAESPETVNVERGKSYIVNYYSKLPYTPLWWPDRLFGKDSDFITYDVRFNFEEDTKGQFRAYGCGTYIRLFFTVKNTAALGSHALYFRNEGFGASYIVWNDNGGYMESPNIHGRLMVTLNVIEGEL